MEPDLIVPGFDVVAWDETCGRWAGDLRWRRDRRIRVEVVPANRENGLRAAEGFAAEVAKRLRRVRREKEWLLFAVARDLVGPYNEQNRGDHAPVSADWFARRIVVSAVRVGGSDGFSLVIGDGGKGFFAEASAVATFDGTGRLVHVMTQPAEAGDPEPTPIPWEWGGGRGVFSAAHPAVTPEAARRLADSWAGSLARPDEAYQPASLHDADSSLNGYHLMPHMGMMTPEYEAAAFDVAQRAGCYLGEMLVRRLGGRWVTASETAYATLPNAAGLPLMVELPNGHCCNPLARPFKVLESGREGESLFGFFMAMTQLEPSPTVSVQQGVRRPWRKFWG